MGIGIDVALVRRQFADYGTNQVLIPLLMAVERFFQLGNDSLQFIAGNFVKCHGHLLKIGCYRNSWRRNCKNDFWQVIKIRNIYTIYHFPRHCQLCLAWGQTGPVFFWARRA